MQHDAIHPVIEIVRSECRQWATPSVTVIAEQARNPYTVLVACIISLRTKDAVTAEASARLFQRASTPQVMFALSEEEIASLIYPAGFYRVKARQIREMSGTLVEHFGGRVPDRIDQLLTLKGVGRKTANLVVTLGYGMPGICVDIHVHRIMNRWGYVATKTPDQTEAALRACLPQEYWIEINDLLVCYGQNRCVPVSPYCTCCKLFGWCDRVGVGRSRWFVDVVLLVS
jgi:endonuclease-3